MVSPSPPGKVLARQRGTSWVPVDSDKPRAMSLGLSRRSTLGPPRASMLSSAAVATPSPLRFSFGPRSSLLPTLPEALDFTINPEEMFTRRSTFHRNTVEPVDPRRSSVFAAPVTDARRSSVMPPPSVGAGRRSSAMPPSAGAGRRSSAAHMFGRISLRISDALGKLSSRPSYLPDVAEGGDTNELEERKEKVEEDEAVARNEENEEEELQQTTRKADVPSQDEGMLLPRRMPILVLIIFALKK